MSYSSYKLDHSPETRVMLDLVRVAAEQRAAVHRGHIAALKQRRDEQKQRDESHLSDGRMRFDPADAQRHFDHQITQLTQQLAREEAVAKDPERFAAEAGARLLAQHICQQGSSVPQALYIPHDTCGLAYEPGALGAQLSGSGI